MIVKNDPALAEADIAELETYASPPFAGQTIRQTSLTTAIYVPGLSWAIGRMLRAAIADQPKECEATSDRLLSQLPVPRSGATTGGGV